MSGLRRGNTSAHQRDIAWELAPERGLGPAPKLAPQPPKPAPGPAPKS